MEFTWRLFTTPWWQGERERWSQWVADADLPLFLDTCWLDAVVAHYRPTLRVWVAFHGGEPAGAIPLAETRWHAIPVWRWLGAELHPDHLDLVAPRRLHDALWASFLAQIAVRSAPPLIFWEGVRETSPLLTLPWPSTLSLWSRAPRPVPYLSLAGLDRDTLTARWTPKLRKEIAYLRRRIARDHPNAQLFRAETPEEVEKFLEQLAQWSRVQHGEESAWNDPRFRAFHQRVALELRDKGQLGLFAWGEPDAPWAIAYGFCDRLTYRYYQPAFHAAYARYSPSKLLIAALLEWGVAQGWQEFDFLLGAEPYKFEWGVEVRQEADWRMGRGVVGRLITAIGQGWR